MKRLFTFGLMLVSAFALTNCAEEIAAPVQDDITVDGNIENITPPEEEVNIPFEVFATVGGEVETKTQNIGNSTYWVANDGISVFHKTGDKITHNKEFTISSENLASGLFEGGLSSVLGETNDWFFLYPYKEFKAPTTTEAGDYSSSGTSLTIKDVQIGAQTINQDLIDTIDKDITLSANSKAYIRDKLSPMFGHLPNRPRNEQPKIEMKHLAAIVAIKIVNKGDGEDIVISSIEFNAPEAIVGTFNIELINKDNLSFEASTATTTARVELPSPTRIEYGKSITIYVPIKPFDASGKEITIAVNGTAVKGNGASRTVTMPANTKFQTGKVTTINVPINTINSSGMFGPISSDLIDEVGYGVTYDNDGKYSLVDNALHIQLSHPEPHTMIINGQEENNVFILGDDPTIENAQLGTVRITGTPAKLIQYAPLGFFVSSWKDKQAIMRVESITVYLASIAPITFDWASLTENIIKDKKKIQFAGMVQLDQVVESDKTHLVILDEEPYHKNISEKKINDLLANFDDNKTDDKNGYIPTLAGLKLAIENPESLPKREKSWSDWVGTVPALNTLTTPEDITAYIIWEKLKNKLSGNPLLKLVSAVLFSSPQDMFKMVYNQPLEVVLSTRPIGEVSEADPTVIATDPRIVVWGLSTLPANSSSSSGN